MNIVAQGGINGDASGTWFEPSVLLGLALLALLGLGVAIWWGRRRWLSDDGENSPEWTLHDLRQLHARGQITDEEFQQLKSAVVSGATAALQRQTGQADRAGEAPGE